MALVQNTNHPSRKGALIAMLLPLVGLALFYSLAAHVYLSLGRWPTWGEGTEFSLALRLHERVQIYWITAMGLLSVYLWPVVLVICAATPKVRWLPVYLAIFTLSVWACFGLGLLAPEPFLSWWWD